MHVFSLLENSGFTLVLGSALSLFEAPTIYIDLKFGCFSRQTELFEDKYLIIPNPGCSTWHRVFY